METYVTWTDKKRQKVMNFGQLYTAYGEPKLYGGARERERRCRESVHCAKRFPKHAEHRSWKDLVTRRNENSPWHDNQKINKDADNKRYYAPPTHPKGSLTEYIEDMSKQHITVRTQTNIHMTTVRSPKGRRHREKHIAIFGDQMDEVSDQVLTSMLYPCCFGVCNVGSRLESLPCQRQ